MSHNISAESGSLNNVIDSPGHTNTPLSYIQQQY